MIKLQAREIVRAAKRLNIRLKRGSPHDCVVGVIAKLVNTNSGENSSTISRNAGIPKEDLWALEMGFENWTPTNHRIWENRKPSSSEINHLMKNRYYKVGQRVAKLAGLPDRDY